MKKLIVFDTTLRDGEQSPGCKMDVVNKLLVAEQLAKLGVDVIEAGFPIASPGDLEAVSRISEFIDGPQICALARTRQQDIESAAKALGNARKPPRIHVFVATSDVHMEKKLRKSPQEILDMIAVNIQNAKRFVNDIQFSPEDAARTGIDFLKQVVSAAVDAGATTINIPDTVGYSVCGEFSHIITEIKNLLLQKNSKAIISVHCHNDLGIAIANTLTGIYAGAGQAEGCILGIGERAGNAQLETVLMALKTRQDYFGVQFGVDTKKIYETARLVSSVIGKPIPDNLPVVGGNAFSHGAGIHQHGMKMDSHTYEIMNPEDVGWQGESTPLVKHSGRTTLKDRLSALGYSPDQELLDNVYVKFSVLADHKVFVFNEDLHLLMQECFVEQMSESSQLIKYERVDYHRVKDALSATVTLSQNGCFFEASGVGDGAVASVGEAILNALKRKGLISSYIRVKDFNISKSAGGIEAVGLANLKIENEKGVGYGRGSDTDIMVAFAKAMVSAINHLMQAPVKESNGEGA